MPDADEQLTDMDQGLAPPRQNGELVFATPWEARAFGLAVALHQDGTYPWSQFSQGLARQIAAAEKAGVDSPYYQRWLQTLEALLLQKGLVSAEELDNKAAHIAAADDHRHPH